VPLDAEARSLIDLVQATSPPVETLTPSQARIASDERRAHSAAPVEDVHQVLDMTATTKRGPIKVRVYRPGTEASRPAVVFFHGGGWVVGDLESHDRMCRSLANSTGAVFVSVGYSRAPEHPYPAAIEDCYAATCWVVAHADELEVDSARIAVMGDSAGGNLAAAVALMARDRSVPRLALQVLLYPVVSDDFDTPSYRSYGGGDFYLTRAAMEWYWDQYVPAGRRHESYATPIRCAELAGLPPAVVLLGECDPLHDEGLTYARRLADSGVPVEVIDFAGGFHGFLSMAPVLDVARRGLAEVATVVRTAFAAGQHVEMSTSLPT
jgi:acetyl esterase